MGQISEAGMGMKEWEESVSKSGRWGDEGRLQVRPTVPWWGCRVAVGQRGTQGWKGGEGLTV